MNSTLLFVTLAFALISFFCSTYTTLRTLLPLLPGHPLNRRSTTSAVGPYGPAPSPAVDKRPRLKSAQRFTAYLATVDIFAACILVWEVACAASADSQLGSSKAAASRIYLATTARPTLLLVVAVLSYANVVQGKQIALGRADWIVWLPALVMYAAGAGLASIASPASRSVWIGLVSWLSTVTFIVTACFGRLLVAILRVRRIAARERALSTFAAEQEKVISQGDMPYLPRHNFSGLSASFLNRIGHSSSSLDLHHAHHVLPFTSDTRSAVSYAPSRPSTEDDYDHRHEFRSPTPGSSRGLLDRSAASTPSGLVPSSSFTPNGLENEPHEVLSVDEARQGGGGRGSRTSLSSLTSRASTYLAPGGFIGNSAVRNALSNSMVREAWAGQDPPGSGHTPKVELSQREARGALALISPFAFLRLLRPNSAAPLVTSILLVLGVCQPGLVLAWQSAASEGFWFANPKPLVLTSSSALAFEKFDEVQIVQPGTVDEHGRSQSRASTVRTWKDSLPGIQPEAEDVSTPKGRFGRALSMMAMHPKLQVLPNDPVVEPSSSASGFIKAATTNGHARLRSLKLSKATVHSFGEFAGRTRPRAGSAASRKTVGGFEHHARRASAPVKPTDTAIALSLLRSRQPAHRDLVPPSRERLPFGFGLGANSHSNSTLEAPKEECSPGPSPCAVPSPSLYPPSSYADHFAFNTHEFGLSPSPATSTFPSFASSASATPSSADPLSIDYLSAHVLPRLVPTITIGKDVKVEPENAPFSGRRSTLSSAYPSDSPASAKSNSLGSRRTRNVRNLSLPLFPLALQVSHTQSAGPGDGEKWVAVEKAKREVPQRETVLAALTQVVRESARHVVESGEPRIWREDAKADQQPLRPSQARGRASSFGTMLDISFDWKQEGATEVLEDQGAMADEEDAEDEDEEAGDAALAAHHRTRQAASPLSPLSSLPSSFRQPSPQPRRTKSLDGSVVLRGSQAPGSSDEEDARTATISCASVHPISTRSDSSSVESPEVFRLRPSHVPLASVSSIRSTPPASSITAPGFHAMIRSRGAGWTSGSEDSGLSSAEEQGRRAVSPPVPLQPGLRPLSLLGQRDINSSYSYSSASESEREAKKVDYHRRATSERDQQKRRSRSGMPLPPLPNVPEPIEEGDEDAKSRKSGTPTPRSRRTKAPSPASSRPPLPLPPTPFATFTGSMVAPPPAKTSPNVTSRTRTRRDHRNESSASSVGDENVRPVEAAPLRIRRDTARSSRNALSAVRSMR
ncbi:hypothetical protein JCM10213v2_000666 [Rhodosporidiobolus nylandii]